MAVNFYAISKGDPVKFLNFYEASVNSLEKLVWADSIINEDFITADQDFAQWYAEKVEGEVLRYHLLRQY